MKYSRTTFAVEVVLSALSGFLFVLTLLWHDWIEIVFRVDPDHGSGALEWALVAVALAVSIVFAVLARVQWRRRVAVA